MNRLLVVFLVVLAAFLLAGCGLLEAKVEYRTVEVPVAVPCIDKPPQRPSYAFGRGEWTNDKDAAAALIADFEAARQYGIEWEAKAAGCSKETEPSAP